MEWIKTSERLPETSHYQAGWGWHSDFVLCWICGFPSVAQYVKRESGMFKGKVGWDFVSGEVKRRPDTRVTYWMHIDPPAA